MSPPREVSFEEALLELTETADSNDSCDFDIDICVQHIRAAHARELAAARIDEHRAYCSTPDCRRIRLLESEQRAAAAEKTK